MVYDVLGKFGILYSNFIMGIISFCL